MSSHVMIFGARMPAHKFKNNPITQEYEERAKNLLKAEIKRRGMGYADLAAKLAEIGIHETERNLANKVSRGGFTAAFMLQCLVAIGAKELRLD